MPFYGSIVVIRRSGVDGSIFPLVSSECLLGRDEGCDIRIQLPTVSGKHCKIDVNGSDQVRLGFMELPITDPYAFIHVSSTTCKYLKTLFLIGTFDMLVWR